MNNTIINEEVVNNSNQSQQTTKNIDSLLRGIKTFEIYTDDFTGIMDLGYLEECLEKLETDESHLQTFLESLK